MRLLCSRHLITTRIPASLEHCTKSLIAPSHCLCAKCFILLRRANNEVGKKKKVSFWKTRNNRQGSAKVARASGAGHGDDRGHLPKARAGSSGVGWGGASVPTRESLTHPPPLSRGPPGSSPSPYFLADVGACLPVQLTGSHGKAIARLAIDRLILPPRALWSAPASIVDVERHRLPPPPSLQSRSFPFGKFVFRLSSELY